MPLYILYLSVRPRFNRNFPTPISILPSVPCWNLPKLYKSSQNFITLFPLSSFLIKKRCNFVPLKRNQFSVKKFIPPFLVILLLVLVYNTGYSQSISAADRKLLRVKEDTLKIHAKNMILDSVRSEEHT